MKFSDIRREDWPELQPYVDTCLLPVTGLDASEPPWLATEKLERLRDLMDPLEIEFRGRLVTYPAYHYIAGEPDALPEICRRLKQSGFRYVIIVSSEPAALPEAVDGCDLILTHGNGATNEWRSQASWLIFQMWNPIPGGNL